jgi:hypothetical protein
MTQICEHLGVSLAPRGTEEFRQYDNVAQALYVARRAGKIRAEGTPRYFRYYPVSKEQNR